MSKSKALDDILIRPAVRRGRLQRQELVQLGSYLKAIRNRLNLTQIELAQRAGLSQPEVCRLEGATSGNGPQVGSVMRYLRACGVKLLVDWEASEDGATLQFSSSPAGLNRRGNRVAQRSLRLVAP